jgi:hypothetical protein
LEACEFFLIFLSFYGVLSWISVFLLWSLNLHKRFPDAESFPLWVLSVVESFLVYSKPCHLVESFFPGWIVEPICRFPSVVIFLKSLHPLYMYWNPWLLYHATSLYDGLHTMSTFLYAYFHFTESFPA